MEEPVVRGIVLRLDKKLRVAILARKFSTVQDVWICEQQSRDMRCIYIESYCSPEAFFPRFPSFSVEDLSVFGGAGFLGNLSFDCYPFEAAERPGRGSRELLVSGHLSVFGGAGFLGNFSFDCYPFEAAERPGRGSRELLVSGQQVDCSNQTEKVDATNEGAIVVRSGPEPAQQSFTFAGKGIFAPVEIREINFATHFLPKIDPVAEGKGMLEAFVQPNSEEEHCQLVLKTTLEDVSSKMADYDEWVHFRTAVRLNTVSSFESLTNIEDQFLFLVETEQVSELFERGRYLELKEIVEQHRALQSLAGLPLLAPEASITGNDANVDLPQITWNEQKAQTEEHQAQGDEQQAQNEPDLDAESEVERRAQAGSSHSSSSRDANNTDSLCPSPYNLQMVVYTDNREETNSPYHEEGSTQAGPQQVIVSSPQATLDADIKLKEVEKVVVSLDSKVQSMDSKVVSLDSKVEELLNIQTFMKHDFSVYKRTFYEKMDTVATNVASTQTSLETSPVRQFTEHQLQIASDLDFVQLQLAELVNHLKEIGDAKKGEGAE
ncbi:hypothetical protein F511_32923 [Dorcoceras hygrometricum]|uniref:Uncharacterized protein n=1 Tax=Dorcoceras hygrometricum TaxID=472368 RepID=A0A2Z7ARZ2_9LAMI|nr:hypothetical protein F511_32923 [Dorcoceras hygrometricum]